MNAPIPMTAISLNRRIALVFALTISSLQAGREFLWWNWPASVAGWAGFIDAYLVSALLLFGVMLASRKETMGRLVMSAGWGFACGILYRSFFQQLGDPTRHGGHETLVLLCKAALLVFSVTGLVIAVAYKSEYKKV